MSEETNPELEKFRKQWQEEVSARSKGGPSSSGSQGAKNVSRPPGPPKRGSSRPERDPPAAYSNEVPSGPLFDGHGYHDLEDQDDLRKLGEEGEGIHPSNWTEPQSALEHYEKAIERESQGNLGDSLALYRKAYRLDSGVDKIYKNKYFPPSSVGSKSKAAIVNSSHALPTVSNPANHSSQANKPPAPPPPPFASSRPIPDLIASFSSFSILPSSPDIEGSPPFAPCPIGSIPSEILIEILAHTAMADIASFARLSLVCKRFAYLIAVEDGLWKEVCLGKDYGFGAMHYDYACTLSGQPLSDLFPSSNLGQEEEEEEEKEEDKAASASASAPVSLYFPLTPLYPTYKTMFQL
ncbi:hypothetical protein MMC31_006105, partial [Peltigera leucophlebia]|nr:hypothetical protein [Peltigera leucophlebia]